MSSEYQHFALVKQVVILLSKLEQIDLHFSWKSPENLWFPVFFFFWGGGGFNFINLNKFI